MKTMTLKSAMAVLVALFSLNANASISAYKKAYSWKDFGTIVAISEIAPMEEDVEVGFEESITEETDLTSTVVDNVYVTLDAEEKDGYDTEEKCIVLASAVTEEQLEVIADKDVQDEAVKENFNGLIFEVPAGKGAISINVQTKGSRTLNVKIGDAEAQTFVQPERGDVEITCTTTENTYVYIYSAATTVAADNNGTYQIYTLDGRPASTLQKGVNIIHYSDGTIKSVYVK